MYKKPFLLITTLFILLVQSCSNKASMPVSNDAEAVLPPAEVSDAFYQWYLSYYGSMSPRRSPFSDKAYRENEYLSQSLVEHIDEIIAGFTNTASYDPFLCAQNIPQEIWADGTFLHGETASVFMRDSFPDHFISLDLNRIEGEWKITNITCDFSPEGTAKAFYTWYLAYITEQGLEDPQNPLVEKAYRDAGFFSTGMVKYLDELTAGPLAADPILLAQDIPQDFTVDPGEVEGIAIVHLQFGTENFHHLRIEMIDELGNWKIDHITLAE